MFTRNLPFEGTEEKEILRQLAEPGFTLDVGGISDNQAKNLLIKLFTEDPKKRMALDKLKVFHILASHYYRLK
jgi:beta-lactamase class A